MFFYVKKWIKTNKDKIHNFSEFSILCPLEIQMRITNLDLPDNDLDFIYKTFKDLNDFLSFNVPGEVETTSLTLWTEEGSGNILFDLLK